MCSRPAFPKSWAAGGPAAWPRSRAIVSRWRWSGLPRLASMGSAPFCIFSNPSASTHPAAPPSTSCFARKSAVEPVEQLLFTL